MIYKFINSRCFKEKRSCMTNTCRYINNPWVNIRLNYFPTKGKCDLWRTQQKDYRWNFHSKFNNSFYSNYQSIKLKNPIKCGSIVFNNTMDEVILVQNNYSFANGEEKWGLPKGHREGNETYATCATRECTEETGLKLDISDKNPKIKINNTYYFPISINKTVYNKILYPLDKKEIRQAKWIKLSELPEIKTNRETQIFIKRKINESRQIINFLRNGNNEF